MNVKLYNESHQLERQELFRAHIGRIIKTRRQQLGMTQQQLAEDAGRANHSFITNIETATTNISFAALLEIVDALDCDLVVELRPRDAIQQ